jgi:hypothetical protein
MMWILRVTEMMQSEKNIARNVTRWEYKQVRIE